MAATRLSLPAIAIALAASACQVAGPALDAVPADPLGVMERLADDDSTVGWQSCTVRISEFGQVTTVATSGQFSRRTADALAAESLPTGTKLAVSDGAESRSLYPAPFAWSGWGTIGEAAISAAMLLDPQSAVAALGAGDTEPKELVDESGNPYLHYEVLPSLSWPREQDNGSLPAYALVQVHYLSEAHAIDIWVGDDGLTDRIRVRAQELRPTWAELQFIDRHDDGGRPVVPRCPEDLESSARGEWVGFAAWDQTLRVPLKIALDPDGRPYDVVPPDGVALRSEPIGSVFSGDGTVIVMDGSSLAVDMVFFDDGNPVVDFGGATELDLTVVWQVRETWEDFLGVRVQVPSTEVDRWKDWEFAYGTDGGVGAFTTGTVMAEAVRRGDESLSELAMNLTNEAFPDPVLMDLDGVDGFDSLYFSNGWGDGAFPMSRGLDGEGNTVALYIFDIRHPWRLMIPDGQPPPGVTAREQEYIECLEGTREVRADGQCPADDTAF